MDGTKQLFEKRVRDYCLFNGHRFKVYDTRTVFEDYDGSWVLAMLLDRNNDRRRFIVLESSIQKDEIIGKCKGYLEKGLDIIIYPVFDDLDAIKKYITMGDEVFEVDYVTARNHSLFWSLFLGLPVPEEYLE